MRFITYMVLYEGGYLYTGYTGGMLDRNKARRRRTGEKFKVVYREAFNTRAEALAREKQIKGWTRAKKEALIDGRKEELAGLAMRRAGATL